MNRSHRKDLVVIMLFFCIVFLGILRESEAHRLRQARIIHLVLHGTTLELYINFLAPRTPQMLAWISLFDENKDRRLSPTEQLKLGLFLKRWVIQGLTVYQDKKKLKFIFKEFDNSALRGAPRLHRYAWDYHFQIKGLSKNPRLIRVNAKLLFPKEIVPVAMVTKNVLPFQKTQTSLPIKRGRVALCRIDTKRTACLFRFQKSS